MPLTEISEIRVANHEPDGPLLGSRLETPQAGTLVDGNTVDTWGWVVGRTHPALSVEFAHAGRLLRRVPVNVERRDVAEHFEGVPQAARAGFRTEIPVSGRAGEFVVDVSCTLSNGQRVPVATVVARRRWRDASPSQRGPRLVSVVVPCFNQAHYLTEAIESVLAQTHAPIEIVVVDDGSPDNVEEVTARFDGVRYVRQERQGLAAARNTGIRRTNGSYLVFLDADDRLTPEAVEHGLASLDAHPDAAFTSGRCRWMAGDGSPLPTPEHGCPAGDLFANLLRTNYTGMPATVMYRRSVFEAVIGFDKTGLFLGVEDYELALRIAREFPVCCHEQVVAEYRIRGGSMSRNPSLMLASAVRAMRAQRPYVRGNAELTAAYEEGLRFWKRYYGEPLMSQIEGDAQRRHWRSALRGAWLLARFSPGLLLRGCRP